MSESEKERLAEKHAEPAPPVDVPDAVRERVRAQASPVRCPFCHDDVRVGEQRWVACAGCLARHHAGCWGEAGRCAACGDGASLAGGGASRVRTMGLGVLATLVVVLVLGGLGLVLRSVERLNATIASRPEPAPPSVPAPPPPPPPPAYLGETPAVTALRLAAHGGDAAAAHDLALALEVGEQVPPDPAEALRWYLVAGDLGDPRAMRVLAESLMTGRLQPEEKRNLSQAIFWYRRALEVDYDQKTALKLVAALGESSEALKWSERLAGEGHVESMVRAHFLAEALRVAKRAELDWAERALVTLREAVARGENPSTLFELLATGEYRLVHGGRWVDHQLLEPRVAEAVALLEQLAADGNHWALWRLEMALRHGQFGLALDEARADELLKEQVKRGFPHALVRYAESLVAPSDQAEAAALLRRAVAAGWDRAEERLATLLERRPDLRQPGDP
jgi:TPR repeat protein